MRSKRLNFLNHFQKLYGRIEKVLEHAKVAAAAT